MIIKNTLKKVGVVLVITTTLLLFWFSSKPENISAQQSNDILLKLNLISQMDVDIATPEYYYWTYLIRKSAHFFIFMVLGVALASVVEEKRWKIILFISLLAISDEVHQGFTSGRGSSLRDVLLDITGGFTGWSIVELTRHFFKSKKKEGDG